MHYEVHALYGKARNSAAQVIKTDTQDTAKRIAAELFATGKYASVEWYQVFADEPDHLLP